ncbi:hypothetical protein KP509_23G016900 [Ceratopteris richardii]|uniref:Uncharacterized protein n=1 Tax=Ceratopteris richardii TaxID=49495 RepID=A0A8T2S0H0_CERRI|nr:hypothetical protein KP509_23G016900 [Ceratopteris richardii]
MKSRAFGRDEPSPSPVIYISDEVEFHIHSQPLVHR